MGYQALLFCPDEKTARTVTHVLNDLDFSVEPCTEPFAAVKKLMAQHFDAVVVDCDNEQNATLLFKSARNSATNQTSLAVAVVEGQSGVAKAFRIGANLVLTKPINVEQAKGTLRVARGLLRKGADTKATPSVAPPQTQAPQASVPVQASAPPARPPVPVARPVVPAPSGPRESVSSLPPLAFAAATPKPAVAPSTQAPVASASSRTTELDEQEPDTILEADDTDVLDVPLTKPASAAPAEPASAMPRNFPWQPAPKPMAEPMATAMRRAAEATQAESASPEPSVEAPAPDTRPFASLLAARSAASAPAPAKEKFHIADNIFGEPAAVAAPVATPRTPAISVPSSPAHTEPPSEPSSYSDQDGSSSTFFPGGYDSDEVEGGGKTKAIVIIAAVVLLASSAAYLSWKDTHNGKSTTPAVTTQSAPPESNAPSGHERSQEASGQQAEATEITLGGAPSTPSAPVAKPSASKPAPKESAAATESKDEPEAEPEVTQRLVVKSETRKTSPPPAQQEDIQAPGSIEMGAPSDTKALANIGTAPVSVPKAAPQTLRVSQGVMEGLVLKKVQPKYPTQALQLRIQGTVQLQATVTREGDIKNLKVLSGDGLLSHAAQEAVKQWKYKPYYLNGEPVEIETQILVNFKLPN